MTPVEPWVVRSLLADEAAEHPTHVRGRHVHEMRPAPGCLERLHHPRRAEQVGLGREVCRIVELDGGGRMDHDLALSKLLATRVAEAEPVAAEVQLEHRQLFLHEL